MMESELACVSILDQDVMVRRQLTHLVRRSGWDARAYATAREFLAEPPAMIPGCLVLDVDLPDLNGLDVQAYLASRTELPIIFLTNVTEISISVRAMKAGALEFLIKPYEVNTLSTAIEYALRQSRETVTRERSLRALKTRYALLSRREREVMHGVVSGRLNKLIAAELDISEVTVKAHRGRMMRKMNARCLPELVTMAAQLDQTSGRSEAASRIPYLREQWIWSRRAEDRRVCMMEG